MKHAWLGLMTMAALTLALTVALPSTAEAQGLPKTFTYQGQLTILGTPASGPYDLEFALWSEPAPGGSMVGDAVLIEDVPVTDGLFKADVDLSPNIQFNLGTAKYLEIRARPGAETGAFTTLAPRQLLTPSPFALALIPGSTIWVTEDGITNFYCFNNGLNGLAISATASGDSGTAINASAQGTADVAIRASAQGTNPNSNGILATVSTTAGIAVEGSASSQTGTTTGVWGQSNSSSGRGVYGIATSQTGTTRGVYGEVSSPDGVGVLGRSIPASGDGAGVEGISNSPDGYAIYGHNESTGAPAIGIYGTTDAAAGVAIRGETLQASGVGYGVHGITPSQTAGAAGVYGEATAATGPAYGVYGRSTSGSGVAVYGLGQGGGGIGVKGRSVSAAGFAGHFENTGNGVAVYAKGEGSGRTQPALRVDNDETNQGIAAYMTNNSNFATGHFANGGTGEVLYLQNGSIDGLGTNGGDFIKAVINLESDTQFRVLSSGEVRSDVGFNTPAADFAEMLPAANDGAGLEPGDVLAIGPDGNLIRSTQPHQSTVAGVYSTKPGFVGGMPVEGATVGTVPLAIMGIVPVKASAENGAIQPGDMLAASATPGHAMRAGAAAPQGTVIGKALSPLPDSAGVIKMLVTLQ